MRITDKTIKISGKEYKLKPITVFKSGTKIIVVKSFELGIEGSGSTVEEAVDIFIRRFEKVINSLLIAEHKMSFDDQKLLDKFKKKTYKKW